MKHNLKFKKAQHVWPSHNRPHKNRTITKWSPAYYSLWLAIGFFLSTLPLQAADPKLIFFANQDKNHAADERVRVRNVTPHTQILFFGDSWVRKNSVSGLVHTMKIKNSNRVGRATLTNVDVVEKAIWCAVDLSTGAYTIDSLNSAAGTELQVSQNALFQSGKSLWFNTSRVDLLIVRPGQTAWSIRAVDGGPTDEGPSQDGQVQIPPAALQSMWSSGSESGVVSSLFTGTQSGDLVIGFNPDDMTYFTFKIGESE